MALLTGDPESCAPSTTIVDLVHASARLEEQPCAARLASAARRDQRRVARVAAANNVEGRTRCHQPAQALFLACTGGQVESGVALGVHGREELCGPSLPLEQVLKGRLVAARRRMQKSHKHTESLGLGQEEACSCN